MRLGIFAKTFDRPTVEGIFQAVRGYGLNCVQFNLSCAGLPSLPDDIPPAVVTQIRNATQDSTIEIAAISGTYNMIHPNLYVRADGLRRLEVLASLCKELCIKTITLCTGTRDPVDMWRWHPDNVASDAWSDLLKAMEAALQIAEAHGLTLAFEPERANVVHNAKLGRALLAAMKSASLKVIIDPANLIVPGDKEQINNTVSEAFDLLGEHIIIGHAKDRGIDDDFCVVGQGILDYDHYLDLLLSIPFDAPLIVHGLAETQVESALEFLNRKLSAK